MVVYRTAQLPYAREHNVRSVPPTSTIGYIAYCILHLAQRTPPVRSSLPLFWQPPSQYVPTTIRTAAWTAVFDNNPSAYTTDDRAAILLVRR